MRLDGGEAKRVTDAREGVARGRRRNARTIARGSAEATARTGRGSLACRNSRLVLGARVVSRAGALFTVVILANHLGDARYGRYVTMVAYSALVSVLADLGLNTLYTREAARDPARITAYLASLLTGKALLGLAAFEKSLLTGAVMVTETAVLWLADEPVPVTVRV